MGCTMPLAVSHGPLTTEARVDTWLGPCEICGRQTGNKTVSFSESFSLPVNIIPPWLSTHISSGGEQQACWWLQLRDRVLPQGQEQQQGLCSSFRRIYTAHAQNLTTLPSALSLNKMESIPSSHQQYSKTWYIEIQGTKKFFYL
jgi:hypothetical protein